MIKFKLSVFLWVVFSSYLVIMAFKILLAKYAIKTEFSKIYIKAISFILYAYISQLKNCAVLIPRGKATEASPFHYFFVWKSILASYKYKTAFEICLHISAVSRI